MNQTSGKQMEPSLDCSEGAVESVNPIYLYNYCTHHSKLYILSAISKLSLPQHLVAPVIKRMIRNDCFNGITHYTSSSCPHITHQYPSSWTIALYSVIIITFLLLPAKMKYLSLICSATSLPCMLWFVSHVCHDQVSW